MRKRALMRAIGGNHARAHGHARGGKGKNVEHHMPHKKANGFGDAGAPRFYIPLALEGAPEVAARGLALAEFPAPKTTRFRSASGCAIERFRTPHPGPAYRLLKCSREGFG